MEILLSSLCDYVMKPAMELRGRVTFAAVWVMFGISEVNDMANAATFGACAQGPLGRPVGEVESVAAGNLNGLAQQEPSF